METTTPIPEDSPTQNKLFVAVFCALLVLPLAGSFLPLDPHKIEGDDVDLITQEAKKTPTGLLGTWTRKIKSDYGFRGSLLLMHGLLEYHILHTNQNGVLFGQNGWKFMNRQLGLEYAQNIEPLTSKQINTHTAQMKLRLELCRSVGADYVRVVAPSKATVYREHLPAWVKPLHEKSRLDQLLTQSEPWVSNVMPDLRKSLQEAKAVQQLYFYADSHWKTAGALVGLNAVYNNLNARSTRYYRPIIPADFPELSYDELPDLIRFMGIFTAYKEQNVYPQFPYHEQNQAVYQFPDQLPEGSVSHFWKTWGKPYDQGGYTTYSWNADPATPHKRCVLVGDSFAEYWPPLLKHEFQEVVFIHHRELPISSEWFEEFKPDVLMDFFVERKLMGEPFPLFDVELQ
ncbi:MAG: hypothetical protein ACFCU1_11770 [Sumerlaeia bacterium]